jgi:hypothetical protein
LKLHFPRRGRHRRRCARARGIGDHRGPTTTAAYATAASATAAASARRTAGTAAADLVLDRQSLGTGDDAALAKIARDDHSPDERHVSSFRFSVGRPIVSSAKFKMTSLPKFFPRGRSRCGIRAPAGRFRTECIEIDRSAHGRVKRFEALARRALHYQPRAMRASSSSSCWSSACVTPARSCVV